MYRVAVYTGTFDPLHIGHLAILQAIVPKFDEVLLVVSPQSPFKGADRLETASGRLQAAQEAVARHPELTNVKVDDIEMHMEPPQYTIRTLDALRSRYPADTSITLVMGADNLFGFDRWKDYSRILGEYGICVYPRPGYDLMAGMNALLRTVREGRFLVVDAPMVDISSTRIREMKERGEDLSGLLM